jgi:hypothetical protein
MLNLPKTYSQKALPWGKEKLGNSELEIEDYGCLMTNLTNIANFFGFTFNPSTINRKLIEVNGFAGAEYIWGSLTKIFPEIAEKYTRTATKLSDAQILEIKASIDAGNPVMIWIDYDPATVKNDMHWVLIIGYDNQDENNFTIIDPIDGKQRSLKEYLKFLIGTARRTIEAYVIYSGKNIDITIESLLAENKKLSDKMDEIANICNN